MASSYLAHLTGPEVVRAQQTYYGRGFPAAGGAHSRDPLGPDEVGFIARRDSFYLASLTETGWPYVQHRGGPAGFLHVLSPDRLAFADVLGNRQMLTTGNVAADPRVSLFLMDYPRRERLKILGRARVFDAREEPALAQRVSPGAEKARVERVVVIDVVSFDWNCPKYITPRFSVEEVEALVAPLRTRIRELETALAAARST